MELNDIVNELEEVRPVISGALREGVWGEVTAFQAGSGSGLWKLEISKERRSEGGRGVAGGWPRRSWGATGRGGGGLGWGRARGD